MEGGKSYRQILQILVCNMGTVFTEALEQKNSADHQFTAHMVVTHVRNKFTSAQ